jgi:uncharacterized membrane protein YuzA (DUF378 family)
MKKKKGNIWHKILYFILGMAVMLVLDMVFQFNNSVEKGMNRELNKAQRKIEDTFK